MCDLSDQKSRSADQSEIPALFAAKSKAVHNMLPVASFFEPFRKSFRKNLPQKSVATFLMKNFLFKI